MTNLEFLALLALLLFNLFNLLVSIGLALRITGLEDRSGPYGTNDQPPVVVRTYLGPTYG